jgi:uncharacterized protein (TIGR03083 family)
VRAMETLTTDRRMPALIDTTATFADLVDGLDPATRVPTCPDWQVRDLVGHIGQAYRWAAGLVRSGEPDAVPDPRLAEPGAPATWARWLHDSAVELVDAVTDVGLDAEVWTFLGPRTAAFWVRRMLNDAVVHVVDAAITAGRDHRTPADVAADVITEGLELLTSAVAETLKPDLAVLRGDGETLLFRPTEPGIAPWRVTRTPSGIAVTRSALAADVELSGPVADVMAVFARRLPPTDPSVTITGDEKLLAHWIAATAF